jgi:hypothetical protein
MITCSLLFFYPSALLPLDIITNLLLVKDSTIKPTLKFLCPNLRLLLLVIELLYPFTINFFQLLRGLSLFLFVYTQVFPFLF